MPSIRVPRHVLVYALHPHLQAGAAVGQHVCEVGRQAVVGPRLDGQADALGAALLRVAHRLGHVGAAVARQRVVQVAHEVVPAVRRIFSHRFFLSSLSVSFDIQCMNVNSLARS